MKNAAYLGNLAKKFGVGASKKCNLRVVFDFLTVEDGYIKLWEESKCTGCTFYTQEPELPEEIQSIKRFWDTPKVAEALSAKMTELRWHGDVVFEHPLYLKTEIRFQCERKGDAMYVSCY